MKIPNVKNKIAYRLLIYILMFSGMVTLIITSIQLSIEYQRDINSIDGHKSASAKWLIYAKKPVQVTVSSETQMAGKDSRLISLGGKK